MTIKTFIMIPKRAGITVQEFHDHWRYPHAVWGCRMTTLHGYVQSHRFHCDQLDGSQETFEGVAEAWFRTVEDAAEFREEPGIGRAMTMRALAVRWARCATYAARRWSRSMGEIHHSSGFANCNGQR